MKIGRNDPCPCGSGKKYKKCCLNRTGTLDTNTSIKAIVAAKGYPSEMADAIIGLYEYMNRKLWIGACHASSAALYVVLSELGFSPKLCLAEVEAPNLIFDHSWVEIDGAIIDLAISLPQQGPPMSGPIVLDTDVTTGQKYRLIYGTNHGRGLDMDALYVATTPFCDFMDTYPERVNGLWDVVEDVLGRKLSRDTMLLKYAGTKREMR